MLDKATVVRNIQGTHSLEIEQMLTDTSFCIIIYLLEVYIYRQLQPITAKYARSVLAAHYTVNLELKLLRVL